MNILSLCDGISCARVALERIPVAINNYYAVEIDKFARTVSDSNFTNIQRPTNDIYDYGVYWEDFTDIDLLVAGFPCQSFSLMGYKKGFDDPRGLVIFKIRDIINRVKPKAFLLENVIMSEANANTLNSIIGCDFVEANSKFYGAQNRRRAFWSNNHFTTKTEPNPTMLKDILLDDDNAKVKEFKRFDKPVGKDVVVVGSSRSNFQGEIGRGEKNYYAVLSTDSKAQTLRCSPYSTGYVEHEKDIKNRVYGVVGKMGTLTGSLSGGTATRYIEKTTKADKTIYAVNAKESKMGALMASMGAGATRYIEQSNNLCRKLSVNEMEVLQGLPVGYTSSVSKSQACKAIGNGFDCNVVEDILRQILLNNKEALTCGTLNF